jgi:signal peptidase I
MGDNRDNSQDSRVQRVVGFVPAENLIGRADLVFISTKGKLWKIWEWFNTLRRERSFTLLNQ